MREDLPARELPDQYPLPPVDPVPHCWARAVNRACTIWLFERGLSDAAEDQPLFAPLAALRPIEPASPATAPAAANPKEEAP